MATDHNFRIKNGLEVGGQLIVDSNGQLVVSAAGANLEFPDNTKLFFGDHSDLSIYHDGSNSYIDEAGTGELRLRSNEVELRDMSNEVLARFSSGGSSVLFYDNAEKFKTHSLGAEVEGQLWINDSNTHIKEGNGDSLRVQTPSGYIDVGPHNTSYAHMGTDRPQFYFNKKIVIGEDILTSYDADLQLQRVNSTKITLTSTGANVTGDLAVSGDLNITGDINSVSVTDLDIVDKTITVGQGQSASNSTGSGLIVSGANANILWDNTDNRWEFNKDVYTDGAFEVGNIRLYKSGDSNNLHIHAPTAIIGPSTTTSSNPSLGTSAYRFDGVWSSDANFSGSLTFATQNNRNALNMNNNNIIGVNRIDINDPGPNEGINFSGGNIKIYESPDDLTTNSAGNLQIVYGSTRRLTVNNSGIDVNGTISSGAITSTGISNFQRDIRSAGQIRATGWYDDTASTDYTGMALEIGTSGTTPHILAYNRDTASYGAMVISSAGLNINPRGNDVTIQGVVNLTSSGHYEINGTTVINSSRQITSTQIHNTGVIYLGSTATANDQFAVNNGTDIFIGTSSKGLRTYKDLHTNSGNNKYWHAGNDGSGSGLDADLLDGQHGSYYARKVYWPDVTTRLGLTVHSLTNLNTQALWSQPAGYQTMIRASQSNGLPTSHGQSYFGYTVTSRRDGGGGYSALLTSYDNSNMYFTYQQNNTAYPTWRKIWHDSNDGSGSGLDADLLDGQHGSYYYSSANPPPTYSKYLRSDTSDSVAAGVTYTWAATDTTGIILPRASGSQEAIHLGGWSTANSTGISRIRTSSNLHIDSPSNGSIYLNNYNTSKSVYMQGGNKAWHAGNDGSGSGLDADLLDGQHGSYYYSAGNPPPTYTEVDTLATVVARGNSTSGAITVGQIYTTNNGNGTNIKIGDDAWFGDTDVANTIQITGSQTAANGYLVFGSSNNTALGRAGTGALTYGGSTVWHAGNDGSGSGLDADLLDGQHGSYYYSSANPPPTDSQYIRSNAADTASGTYTFSRTTTTAALDIAGHAGAASYNYFLRAANDGGNKVSMFINGSTRTADGGINTFTIRNDGGPINLGAASHTTKLLGSGDLLFNGNKVWHAGNDGSGSGLDADLLDGQHGSYYATASSLGSYLPKAGGTMSGNIAMANNNITGVNQLEFNDPGEGIVFKSGSSGDMVLKIIDDSSDNILQYSGTNAIFNVQGSITATTKSFDIEHPTKEGMRLHHGVLEGPEHAVYIRGRTKGSLIQLPEYWTGLVHEDTITVQLTPIGKSSELYVKDISDNKVLVSNDTEYFYFIQAERKDIERFEVEYGNSL